MIAGKFGAEVVDVIREGTRTTYQSVTPIMVERIVQDHIVGGTPVAGGSTAWGDGGPLASELDDYNNGRLCAPHCDTLPFPNGKATPQRSVKN